MSKNSLTDEIDKLLPQTQCGLCSYGGCRPYAEAIVEKKEAINRCPPGGVKILISIATLTKQDPAPYIKEMESKTKLPSRAVIREAECIGCTKCIQACPVDAILGSSKKMHTVIADECTGCELCIEPCPVDCIDMIQLDPSDDLLQLKSSLARKRFNARNARLASEKESKNSPQPLVMTKLEGEVSRKAAIEAAIARVRAKKATNNES